ncbi:MAG: transcription elongation factor GreA [Spirochaetes bacterium]|nr:transcription elongation factor GreA [Spirochaetota bacterium]MBN2772508.1 transcription elongation factor GreA [Spirochaetota bacterium]HRX16307.1 transcription elongation factor GreA [Spirochaetota bacterium]
MSNDIEKRKQELRDELDALKHEFKVELPLRIAEAREHGDLKENADYHAARERQGFVQAKIAQLSDQLAKIASVNVSEIMDGVVGFGSEVTLADQDSSMTLTFTLVTEAESNPSENKIAFSTPYGKALAGKKAGDIVEVTIPVGVKKFKIMKLKTIHGSEYSA